MHRIILIIASALAAFTAAMAQPRAVFVETRHDFGPILEDNGLAQCEFKVVNEGTSPLTILSARASCGCTTPEYSRKPIAPGDTALIGIAFDPAGRPGRFSKSIVVETNSVPSKTKLEIAGVVVGSEETVGRRYPVDLGPLKLSKSTFALGDATMGRLKTVYLEGYNRSTDSLRIAVADVPPYLDIAVAPQTAPPGEQVTLIAYVMPHKGADYGVVDDTITVRVGQDLEYKLPTLLTVHEDFSKTDPSKLDKAPIAVPSTDRIELGMVDKSGAPLTARLRLENAGKSDLAVRRIYSVDPGVVASIPTKTIKKGKSAEITVAIDPSLQQGAMLNIRLQIITNDPLQPVHTVRILGEWKK